MTIAEFIKKERKRMNLTQREFAEKAGMSESTLIRLVKERNTHELKPKTVRKLAESTGKSEQYIASMI